MADKLEDILKGVKVGTEIGKIFVPGGVGKILDVVNRSIKDAADPDNHVALKALAKVNAEQTGQIAELTQAVLALHERLKKVESGND